jgi:DnaJ-class molecular chaperone
VIETKQFGPGFVQQVQNQCKKCKGTGDAINFDDKCTTCSGTKIERIQKRIDIDILKGVQDGENFIFEGEGDEAVNKKLTNSQMFILET